MVAVCLLDLEVGETLVLELGNPHHPGRHQLHARQQPGGVEPHLFAGDAAQLELHALGGVQTLEAFEQLLDAR